MDAARATPPSARPSSGIQRDGLHSGLAAALYLVVALAFTWPLPRGLARDIPADLGDSLLNMWILSWDAEQIRHLFSGDLSVLARWFDGNIFYPVGNVLAYSEHLIPQAVQVFPVYLLTRNPILCYNLLLLSTYVLSGLGTYLLVRELTGDRRAAFVAGLIFAFVPYRIPQTTHLQVLSSQWMPFTLYGFARYLNTGRRRALAGGALALLAQALSCGYYLVFFSPFAAAFVVWELTRRGRLRDRRAWTDFALAAVATGLVLTPFLLPYAEVQSTIRLERQIQEISLYSADVYAYVTSFPTERFWGPLLQIAPRPEGELFMGLIPLALGLLALGFVLADAWRAGRNTADTWPMLSRLCGAACIVLLALVTIALFTRRVSLDLGVASIRVTQLGRVLLWLLLSSGLWLLCSARARVRLRACFVPEGFFLASIVTAWWLSLGPTPRSFGRTLDFPALYSLLYALPGVDGLRVPARFAMVMALMLAVAAGYALARLCQRRHAIQLLAAIAALFLFEASPSSVSINGLGPTQGHPLPEARMYPPATAPLVYRTFAGLEGSTVLLELPIGDSTWDVRAVYYAAAHWRPLVNGYSGFFPPHYGKLILGLSDPDRNPESAWQTLVDSGATHVLLHERAFREAEAAQIDRWLLAHQARVVMRADGDVLYDVRH